MADASLRERFGALWSKHFDGAELPLCLMYRDEAGGAGAPARPEGHVCVIGQLARARRGEVLYFGADSFGCFGGQRYLGFSDRVMENFEYFLSCGIAGKLEGERYKKTPQTVRDAFANVPPFRAPARYAIFKRWDKLEDGDVPDVVIFFARPDVLAGLFTLAGFDETRIEAVVAPFGAGCATIVQYPYLQGQSDAPKAVLGLFDVSARPFVEPDVLTFSVPMAKFERMVADMDESFLITQSWAKVRRRIARRDES